MPRTPSNTPSASKPTSRSQYWSRSWTADEKMLAPVLDPFDRTPQHQRGRRDNDLFRIHHELGAEAAADLRRDDAHLVLVKPQQRHQERPHLVGELRRGPQRQTILVHIVDRERAAALDRMGAAPVLFQLDARPDAARAQRPLRRRRRTAGIGA